MVAQQTALVWPVNVTMTLDVAVNKAWLVNGPYFVTGAGTNGWGSVQLYL